MTFWCSLVTKHGNSLGLKFDFILHGIWRWLHKINKTNRPFGMVFSWIHFGRTWDFVSKMYLANSYFHSSVLTSKVKVDIMGKKNRALTKIPSICDQIVFSVNGWYPNSWCISWNILLWMDDVWGYFQILMPNREAKMLQLSGAQGCEGSTFLDPEHGRCSCKMLQDVIYVFF